MTAGSSPQRAVTVGYLRAAIADLPDTAGILLEDDWGRKYDLVRARAIGTRTDDPGLILHVVTFDV